MSCKKETETTMVYVKDCNGKEWRVGPHTLEYLCSYKFYLNCSKARIASIKTYEKATKELQQAKKTNNTNTIKSATMFADDMRNVMNRSIAIWDFLSDNDKLIKAETEATALAEAAERAAALLV